MSQKSKTKVCPSCKTDSVGENEGILVCENCGFVLEECNLRFEVELHSTSSKNGEHIRPVGSIVSSMEARTDLASSSGINTRNPRQMMYGFGDSAKREGVSNCTRIASLLRMNKSDEDQMLSKVTEVMNKKGKWKTGRRGEFIVASCAYIVARQNSRPITILDISDKIQASPFDLGRVYSHVLSILGISLPDIDPALFIHICLSSISCFSQMENISNSSENSNLEYKKQISNLSLRIINIAKNEWILTGRKPTAITAAAIIIAFNTLSSSSSSKNASYTQLSKEDIKNLCASLSVSVGTVNARVKEMKKLLVDMGKLYLPWGNDIDIKNITFHIPSVFSYMELLEKSPKETTESPKETEIKIENKIKTLPPSMYKRQAIKQRRLEKLIRAKHRISISLSSKLSNSNNSPSSNNLSPSSNHLSPSSNHLSPSNSSPSSPSTHSHSNHLSSPSNSPPSSSTIALLPLISEDNNISRSRKRIKRELDQNEDSPTKQRRNSLLGFINMQNDIYTNLDDEDLEIEKSLLQGIPENIILETDSPSLSAQKFASILIDNYAKESITTRNLDSEDLTEQDIPDYEISNFIKSSEEIEKEQQLLAL